MSELICIRFTILNGEGVFMNASVLQSEYFGNTIEHYLIALACLIGGFLAVKIFQIIIVAHMQRFVKKTKSTLDDFVLNLTRKIILPVGYFSVLYLCITSLTLNEKIKQLFYIAGITLITYFSVHFVILLIDYFFELYLLRRSRDRSAIKSLSGIVRVVKVIIWGIALSFFFDNLGFKISAVIAGLGIGGVAVALAAQAVLGDLFSYFSILFDRPFEIGDFIIVGDFLGTVEKIGIKTTRLISLSGEQLIFSNSDLTNSRVRNYKRMQKRRVVFKFGVTYQTSLDNCKNIPELVKSIVNAVEHASIDRVHFLEFGDFSLIYEVVYYVDSSDYNVYMDCQQAINFSLKDELEKRSISFAFPTQTLYVSKQES
jgi:small-conductance mechanosensitive channel